MPGWRLQLGEVEIAVHPVVVDQQGTSRTAVLAATVELSEKPEQGEDRLVLVPVRERELCEDAIRQVADLLGVFLGGAPRLSSGLRCVGFVPMDEAEHQWLDLTSGMMRTAAAHKEGAHFPLELDRLQIEALFDRPSGVALMSELMGQQTPLSQYRSAIRLFEAAFALPSRQLGKKLAQFLANGHLAYGRPTIESWLRPRDAATHGDLKVAEYHAFDSHVRPYVNMMRDGARDVLLNKAVWHNRSRIRRDIWKPTAWNTESGGFALTSHTEARAALQVPDEFGAFALALDGEIPLPDSWWSRGVLDGAAGRRAGPE